MSERVWVVDEYCDSVREKDGEGIAIYCSDKRSEVSDQPKRVND